MPNEDVTLGEVYRLIQGIQKDIREQNSKFVPIDLYISERDGLREDIKELNAALTETKTQLNVEHNARIQVEQDKEKEASSKRLQWTLIIASPIATLLVTWFLTSAGLIHTSSL